MTNSISRTSLMNTASKKPIGGINLTGIMLAIPISENEKIVNSGNLHPSTFTDSDHHCHMFQVKELERDLREASFEILELSASNCLSTLRSEALEDIKKDPDKWAYFLDLEISACKSPGMVESGTHIIAVIQKKSH